MYNVDQFIALKKEGYPFNDLEVSSLKKLIQTIFPTKLNNNTVIEEAFKLHFPIEYGEVVDQRDGEYLSTVNSSDGYVCFHPWDGAACTDFHNGNELDRIDAFDVEEYRKYYGHSVPNELDILDIGYWTDRGAYEPPCDDWRREVALLRAGLDPDGNPANDGKSTERCANCGKLIRAKVYTDQLGPHCVCYHCGASFGVDGPDTHGVSEDYMFRFIKFSYRCVSQRKEGLMLYQFPLPQTYSDTWLTIEELHLLYKKYMNTDLREHLEMKF